MESIIETLIDLTELVKIMIEKIPTEQRNQRKGKSKFWVISLIEKYNTLAFFIINISFSPAVDFILDIFNSVVVGLINDVISPALGIGKRK